MENGVVRTQVTPASSSQLKDEAFDIEMILCSRRNLTDSD